MWKLARRIATSRLGQLLFVAHLCLVLYLFSQKPVAEHDPNNCIPQSQWGWDYVLIAGRPFHWHYESALMKVISVLDLPAGFISSILYAPVSYLNPNICVHTASWIEAVLLLLCASAQWLLLGFILERLLFRGRKPI
jgi:hypothetical protein